MILVGNFYFSIFLRLTWKLLGLKSERGVSVCWPNNKIIDFHNGIGESERGGSAPINAGISRL